MEKRTITVREVAAYERHLRESEHSRATREKYLRALNRFVSCLDGGEVTKEVVIHYKEELSRRYSVSGVNGALAAINGLLTFLGWPELRVKALRQQKRIFGAPERELSREEYLRLLDAARRRGRERLALVMETICATGVRVSEVRYFTVEAVRQGRAEISLKGKVRVILIPTKLARKLLKYARKNKTASGEIFLTGNGKSLSRRQIWAEMKRLCAHAGVEPSKVFPHNLRHCFATAYYRAYKDIAKLADVLGHSSIETTRIYLLTSGTEHQRQLDRLGLVS